MNIAVITLHYVTNFGSLLQTYATQMALEKLGHKVVIVDFRPSGLSFYRAVWPHNCSTLNKIVKLPFRLVCNGFEFPVVDTFLKRYIHLTSKRYHTFQALLEAPPKADYYVSGSDQIWNTQNANKPDDLGAYYLAFVNSKKKIAYASSFGKTEFTQQEQAKIKNWLRTYKAIAVREDRAVQTLQELGFEGKCVVDPTLLLTCEEWLSFLHRKLCQRKYIFVYNLNRNKLIEKAAKELAEENGLEIINFADTFEFIKGAKNRIINTPLDFIYYLSNAAFVITDSFHGTAFSINFSKQFVSVPAPKYNSRLESILRQTNCMDRLISSVEEAKDCFENSIEYDIVQNKLTQMREESYAYLREVIQ